MRDPLTKPLVRVLVVDDELDATIRAALEEARP